MKIITELFLLFKGNAASVIPHSDDNIGVISNTSFTTLTQLSKFTVAVKNILWQKQLKGAQIKGRSPSYGTLRQPVTWQPQSE